jgi:phenylalanyl-tRNA synthetase beta chain
VQRDIAVIVADSVTHDAVLAAVHAAPTGGLLQDALLFDVYKPKQSAPGLAAHEKSLAVRLTLASAEATLTDEQIDAAVQAVVNSIAGQLGGRLRG